MDPRNLRRVFAMLMVLAGLQLFAYQPFLPGLVAHQFDASGAAAGWLEKGTFLLRHAVLLLALPIVCLLLPTRIVRHWPARLLWRGRGYWLRGERREQAAAKLERLMVWLALASLGFVVLQMQLLFDANTKLPPALDVQRLWLYLGAYLLFLALWLWRTWRAFRSKP